MVSIEIMKLNLCCIQISLLILVKRIMVAFILVEVNDIGDQVASILHFDLEYDNLLMCSMRGRNGQIVGAGFLVKNLNLV